MLKADLITIHMQLMQMSILHTLVYFIVVLLYTKKMMMMMMMFFQDKFPCLWSLVAAATEYRAAPFGTTWATWSSCIACLLDCFLCCCSQASYSMQHWSVTKRGIHPAAAAAAAAPQATEAPQAPLSELHGFVLSIMTYVAYYLPLLLYIPSLKKQKLVQGSLVETMQSWWGSGRPCSSCLLWERKSKPKTKY